MGDPQVTMVVSISWFSDRMWQIVFQDCFNIMHPSLKRGTAFAWPDPFLDGYHRRKDPPTLHILYTHYIICKIYDLFSLAHTMLLTKEHQQKYVVSFNVWSIVSMQVSMVIARLVSTCFFVTGTATKKEICWTGANWIEGGLLSPILGDHDWIPRVFNLDGGIVSACWTL